MTRWSNATPGPSSLILTATQEVVTELDAIIAYMQMLGTLVDFSTVERATLVQ